MHRQTTFTNINGSFENLNRSKMNADRKSLDLQYRLKKIKQNLAKIPNVVSLVKSLNLKIIFPKDILATVLY